MRAAWRESLYNSALRNPVTFGIGWDVAADFPGQCAIVCARKLMYQNMKVHTTFSVALSQTN